MRLRRGLMSGPIRYVDWQAARTRVRFFFYPATHDLSGGKL